MTLLPLTGLRVVDLTVERGELCSRLLGDLGAEVIKVEPPGGSAARALPPVRAGVSLAWAVRNAGKLGVVLDLSEASERDRLHQLLTTADVVMLSGGPLDGRELAAAHPHLVVAAITAFGLDGPYANWVATDGVLAATSGMAFKAGVPEDVPLLTPGLLGDDVASSTAAFAVLCALWQRHTTGAGQFVEVSVNEAIAQTADWALPNTSVRIRVGESVHDVRAGSGKVYPIFRCKGGFVRLVVLSARQWHALRAWLGEPDFLQDPEYDSFPARLAIADAVLNPTYEAHFADLSMEEVSAEAQRRGIVCTPVLEPAGVLANEHLRSRGTFVDLEVAPGVVAPVASGFFEIDGCRVGPKGPPPGVGEHTEQVLAAAGPRRPAPSATDVAVAAPLAGLRVMDFGHGGVGVETGRLYAEYGAEVIKIESRRYPDFMRLMSGTEMSPSFASSSRSKQSLGVDAKSEEGRALLLRLVQQSDVVIENNSTGTMDALGVGFDDLAATNPGIIMVSSQLMGTRGPWADWRGYGPSTQPPGGLVHLWNYADREDPAGSQAIFPDHFAGRLGAVASLAGLLGRARGTCGGLHAEVAQVEAVTGVLSDLLAAEAVEPGSVRPLGSRSERAAPWGMYPCAGDEQWVAITCRDDADWHALVDAMGAPPWADASLSAGPARLARQDELDDRIAEWTSQHPNEEIARRCQERGVPAGPMMTGLEMLTHPHYVARGFQVEIDQPGIGLITFDGPAFRGSAMRGPDVRPAPTLGQHTRQICRSLLSLDDAEIDRLLSNGVLDTTPPWKETHQ